MQEKRGGRQSLLPYPFLANRVMMAATCALVALPYRIR